MDPYGYSQNSQLFLEDFALSVRFCEWLRHENAADEIFLHKIVWTDKAMNEGIFDVQNRR